MLDLQRLKKVKLATRPIGQLVVANAVLFFDYRFPKKTEIILEGQENLPKDGGCFLAMNHTDRYNYWPLQYKMYRSGLPFTATWVKGKYYENPWIGRFMDSTNNIPIPSRGYVLTTEFRKIAKRVPDETEYRSLRQLANGEEIAAEAAQSLEKVIGQSAADFAASCKDKFAELVDQLVVLNKRALWEKNINVMVFPTGTRSTRIIQAHTGIIQMTQHLGAPIIPIGCNGSDHVYPGNSPFAKGGRIVYRIGKPIPVDGPELGPYRVPSSVRPLTKEAEEGYGEQYRAMVDIVMDRINELVDPQYQRSDGNNDEGEKGTDRFV